MAATIQTKLAIRQMREAGFDRAEFSVNVERNWRTCRETKRRYVEYGQAIITTYADREKIESKIRDLLNVGLGVLVVEFTYEGRRRRSHPQIITTSDYRGRYVVRDLDADMYGDDDERERYFGKTMIYAGAAAKEAEERIYDSIES